jgi:regulator of replication initiation timing
VPRLSHTCDHQPPSPPPTTNGQPLQAKIQDLHQQIEELTHKVGNLQTENAALHSRTSILEKVLDMRNEQIQVMQESKEVSRECECVCVCWGAGAQEGRRVCWGAQE